MKKINFIVFLTLSIILIGCETDPEAEYSVNYYGNGNTYGFPPEDRNSYLSGETAAVKGKNTLLKSGYKFINWNTKQNGNGETYHEGDIITINNINVFLYAIWEEE